MRPLVALLFVTAAFVGCFDSGGDDAFDPSVAHAAGDAPTLPEGLEMEGAEVVSYTEAAVVWRWKGTTGPGVGGAPPESSTTTTPFDVPAAIGLAVEVNVTWENDDATDIGVRIHDANGALVCSGEPPASAIYPSPAPVSACSSAIEALATDETWTVSAVAYTARQTATPFTVDLRLKARPSMDLAEVGEFVPFEAVADDGTALRGHVYLPDTEPPYATILELSGYWNSYFGGATGNGGATDARIVEERGRSTLAGYWGHFMDAGFAVAMVNIRGTGLSDGCQDFAGPQDVADAGLVIETLADQSWSSGRIGLVGGSWPGTSVYTGISSAASSLKAAASFSATLDWWHDRTHNGAIKKGGLQTATYDALGTGPVPVPNPNHAACPGHEDHVVEDALLRPTGDRTPWFTERNHRPGLDNTTAAIFGSYGMANAEWVPLRDNGWWDRIPHDDKRLMLGPWRHGEPARADFWPSVVDWFDHYLRDGAEPAQIGLVEVQDSTGTLHRMDQWPPASDPVRLFLSDRALMLDQGRVTASMAQVPSSDRRALPDTCSDSGLFVSPPLASDVVVAGVFQANVTVSSTVPDGNFAANLWHVAEPWPCGSAPGTQGVTGGSDTDPSPGLQRFEVGFGLSDLWHRGHLDRGSEYPTGDSDVMRMTSESFATFVPAGERLVLAIGGGDPLLEPDPHEPVLTVHTGADVEGELVLTVIEGDFAFEGEGGPNKLVGGVVG